jgi:hypothetical protein
MFLPDLFPSLQQERVREGFLKCFLPNGYFESLSKVVLFNILDLMADLISLSYFNLEIRDKLN